MDKYAEVTAKALLKAYTDLLDEGKERAPRGQLTKEILDYRLTIDPRYPLTTFDYRKFNLQYAVAELIWYLVGDRYDLSICKYGSMWSTLIQEDGGLNSNYGQTIFGTDRQFDWVVSELIRDKDSRRAVFIIGDKNYLDPSVNDQRCCQFIQFYIRDNTLHCYASFRSSDAIWGLTNDLFTLCEIMKYVYVSIKQYKPKLKLGLYTHHAVSFHTYEKHFAMMELIVNDGMNGFYQLDWPQPKNPEEFYWLRENNHQFENVPAYYKYANHLIDIMNRDKNESTLKL